MSHDGLRIEKIGESKDEKTGHTHHTHDVYEGDRKVGSFQALTHPDKPLSFKLGGGLRMKHARPIFDYMQSNFGKSKSADVTAKKMVEGLAANTSDSKRSASQPPRDLASMHEEYRTRAPVKRQKAVCTTEGCGGDLQFVQVRNKHGFEQTVEHCPSCKSTKPVQRRVATSADASDAAQIEASRARWNSEQMTKADPSAPVTGQVTGPIDPKVELDHDRRRLKGAIFNLLGKHESPNKPDGKVNLAKSLAGQAKYRVLLPKMQRLVADIVDRPEYDSHHDHAAFMIGHAQHHLGLARNHMLQTEPSKVDSVRHAIGLEPLHMKHLAAADTFLRAAKVMKIRGDHNLFARGVLTEHNEDMKRGVPPDNTNLKLIRRAYDREGGTVAGSAAALRKMTLRTDATGTNVVTPKSPAKPRASRTAPKSDE